MTEFEYISNFGAWIGLLLYIFIHDGIPFLRDKFWPAIREDSKEKQMFRREADARLLDLEERKITNDEQMTKSLILLMERVNKWEREMREHDVRMANTFSQITTTQNSIQSVLAVLLDRVSRSVPDNT